ncbi:MAG TPA: alpha/beta hydrolase domain-containing protein [Acidobacteriaceae bacterium]|nr:alpha/beta hydrolase domain-containing protein [Acidobacteriaceae bacterium]
MRFRRSALSFLLVAALAVPAFARVTGIDVLRREPVLGGMAFGPGGPYEEILARVHFAVRPDDPHDRGIVDLDLAPRSGQGEVEFSADLWMLRPVHGGNGALLLEIPNRGGKGMLWLVDGGTHSAEPGAASDFGDAWLLRQGYTVADLGWQWDAPPGGLRLYAPVATDHGQTITGLLRDDFTPAAVSRDWPLGHIIIGRMGGTEYPVANPDDPRNVLTVRDTPTGPRSVIPRAQWSFMQPGTARFVPIAQGHRLEAPHGSIHLNAGFQPGRIYELVYVVKDPVVAGLGFAAVRDFVSWLKYGSAPASTSQAVAAIPASNIPPPIAPVHRAYALGISQCGRWLRTLLYEGFNEDEQDRMALDGILAHVGGAGRGSFNVRFAQPSRDAEPMSSIFYPTDIFPFTGLPEQDSAHPHAPAQGLLDRTRDQNVLPRIFFSHTSFEYWGRAASLIHTTADGRRDMPQDLNVRIYFFAGLQHFSGPFPPQRGTGELASQNLETPLPIRWFWRGMISNMNRWVRDGVAPPPTTIPHIADGTLVPLSKLAFPAIPGVHVPRDVSEAWHLDFGPRWQQTGILSIQPPVVGAAFPVLVPQVDADGIDRAGVHLPEITVPLATYTGWNLRDPSTGAPEQRVSFLGSYFPFAKTAAERKAAGDPRLSIDERYPGGRDEYLARYKKAVDILVRQRWILPDDAPALMQQGEAEWDYATK